MGPITVASTPTVTGVAQFVEKRTLGDHVLVKGLHKDRKRFH